MKKLTASENFMAELDRTAVISKEFKGHLYALMLRCMDEAYNKGVEIGKQRAGG